MRVAERQMLDAVRDFKTARCGSNTRVVAEGDTVSVYLFDNLIFRKEKGGKPRFTNAGWDSNTTKSRLNVLLLHFGFEAIYQKDYVWYWDERLHKESRPCEDWYIG